MSRKAFGVGAALVCAGALIISANSASATATLNAVCNKNGYSYVTSGENPPYRVRYQWYSQNDRYLGGANRYTAPFYAATENGANWMYAFAYHRRGSYYDYVRVGCI